MNPALALGSLGALAVHAAVAAPAAAQLLASERAVATQVVNGATLTVEYYRPAVRGREVFGRVVHWGETWTPGANWATTLETDRDLRVDGRPLPKGKYAIWVRTAREGDWVVGFAPAAERRFHLPAPRDTTAYALRLPVRPRQGAATERLTWSFPAFARDSAVLQLQWAGVVLPLHLAVVRPPAPTLTAEQTAPYVGRYRMRYDGDTTLWAMRVVAVPGGLEAMIDSAMAPPDLGPRLALVPDGAGRFFWGTFLNGEYVGVEENLYFTFTMAGGRATALEAHDTNSAPTRYAGGPLAPEPPARRRRPGR
jgi:hypothetical protein